MEEKNKISRKKDSKGYFFLDTCIKIQYKGFNFNFLMSDHGDKTI